MESRAVADHGEELGDDRSWVGRRQRKLERLAAGHKEEGGNVGGDWRGCYDWLLPHLQDPELVLLPTSEHLYRLELGAAWEVEEDMRRKEKGILVFWD